MAVPQTFNGTHGECGGEVAFRPVTYRRELLEGKTVTLWAVCRGCGASLSVQYSLAADAGATAAGPPPVCAAPQARPAEMPSAQRSETVSPQPGDATFAWARAVEPVAQNDLLYPPADAPQPTEVAAPVAATVPVAVGAQPQPVVVGAPSDLVIGAASDAPQMAAAEPGLAPAPQDWPEAANAPQHTFQTSDAGGSAGGTVPPLEWRMPTFSAPPVVEAYQPAQAEDLAPVVQAVEPEAVQPTVADVWAQQPVTAGVPAVPSVVPHPLSLPTSLAAAAPVEQVEPLEAVGHLELEQPAADSEPEVPQFRHDFEPDSARSFDWGAGLGAEDQPRSPRRTQLLQYALVMVLVVGIGFASYRIASQFLGETPTSTVPAKTPQTAPEAEASDTAAGSTADAASGSTAATAEPTGEAATADSEPAASDKTLNTAPKTADAPTSTDSADPFGTPAD